MTEPVTAQLGDLANVRLDDIVPFSWTLMRAGAEHAANPFHFPVVSTVTPDGVDARVIVLRSVNEQHRTMEFHTDKRSSKVQQMKDNRSVMWVFYDPARKLQLRVRGAAHFLIDNEAIEAKWNALNEHTKRAYAQELVPGTPVDTICNGAPCPDVENPEIGKPNFVVVVCVVHEIEWLKLSRTGHQSALVRSTPDGWSSTWIMP